MEKFSFEMKQFVTVDLKSWKTKLTNSQKTYDSCLKIFVYREKMYIQDLNLVDPRNKLDELDMNGKKVRTISFKTAKGKEDYVVLQGIMDGAIYYMTWNGNQHKLKSKDLVTGEEKTVMQ